MKNFYIVILITLVLIVNILRFYKLDSIPHGFHVDEYAASVSLQCLGKEGTGPWGEKNNFFLQQGFGTPKPPNYTYPALWWMKAFNYKVEALRSFSVLAIILGLVGLFLLGRVIAGPLVGLWALVAGSISPWSWALGRLGWESFFAPVAIIWALFFFFKNRNYWDDLFAGLLFCAGAYFYPPARIFILLFMPLLICFEIFFRNKRHQWWILALAFVLPLIPLIKLQLSGSLNYRVNEVAIWNPAYLETLGSNSQTFKLIKGFWINYTKHLDPQFLFISGDPDFKHSTQQSGIFSWLDIVALLILLASLLFCWVRSFKESIFKFSKGWILFFILAFMISIIPSGLTFLGTPNELRICLGWPFICLLTGVIISWVSNRHWVLPFIMTTLVIGYAFFYLGDYFKNYSDRSKGMFSYWIYDEVKNMKNQQEWLQFLAKYYNTDYHVRYYLMNNLGQSCSESYQTWKNVLTLLCQKNPNLPRCETISRLN